MGLLKGIKEKVVGTISSDETKEYEEEMNNLDELIEDIFRIDEENQKNKNKVKISRN
jgi:hypothetical protein